jgi:hypothetical protein
MGTFNNKWGESCLAAMVGIILAVRVWGSVHPVESNLLFDGGHTEFLFAWDFPVYPVTYLFDAGISFLFKLPGCQCCIHGECPVPLGFQM